MTTTTAATTCYYCGLPTRRGACDDCGTVPSALISLAPAIAPEAAARIRAAHEEAQRNPEPPCTKCTDTTVCDDCLW